MRPSSVYRFGPARYGRTLALVTAIAAVGAAVPALSDATSLSGRVAKVKDGDSIALKVGKRVRAFDLAGVDAPELTGDASATCFGPEAKAKLAKLLRKGARVKVTTHGSQAEVVAGRTNVNRAMVQGGFARATALSGKLGSLLSADQAAAQAAGKGMWGACKAQGNTPTTPGPSPSPSPSPGPAPSPNQPPASGDISGQQAIDRMTEELKGGRWRQFTSSSTGTSTEYILNLCANGSFFRTAQSDFGGLIYRYGTWKVTQAQIAGDGSYRAAAVTGTVAGGDPQPDSSTYETFLGAKTQNGADTWYWGDSPAQYFAGAATCS